MGLLFLIAGPCFFKGAMMEFRCPKCNKILPDQSDGDTAGTGKKKALPKHFPFCCDRCKLLDCGAWIDEDNRNASCEDQQE